MRALLDGATVGCGGREFTVHDEPPDEDGHGAFYYTCDTCDGTVRGGDNALAAHECPPACPECGQRDEDARVEVRNYYGDTFRTWRCCGVDQRCPGCGAVAAESWRYSDEIGTYCTRCSWSAS